MTQPLTDNATSHLNNALQITALLYSELTALSILKIDDKVRESTAQALVAIDDRIRSALVCIKATT